MKTNKGRHLLKHLLMTAVALAFVAGSLIMQKPLRAEAAANATVIKASEINAYKRHLQNPTPESTEAFRKLMAGKWTLNSTSPGYITILAKGNVRLVLDENLIITSITGGYGLKKLTISGSKILTCDPNSYYAVSNIQVDSDKTDLEINCPGGIINVGGINAGRNMTVKAGIVRAERIAAAMKATGTMKITGGLVVVNQTTTYNYPITVGRNGAGVKAAGKYIQNGGVVYVKSNPNRNAPAKNMKKSNKRYHIMAGKPAKAKRDVTLKNTNTLKTGKTAKLYVNKAPKDSQVFNGALIKPLKGSSGVLKGYDGGLYYFKSKKVQTKFTGVQRQGKIYYYVYRGKVDTTFQGTAEYKKKYYIVRNGQLVMKGEGIQKAGAERYYVKKGVIQTNYSGELTLQGKTYKIEKGRVVG